MARMKPLGITQERLKELFVLHQGVFYWRINAGGRINVGDVAGGINDKGYHRMSADGTLYMRSRLVWLYMTGNDSHPLLLDHINRVRTDDRLANLRLATHSENNRNRATCGISKYRGVTKRSDTGKWTAEFSYSMGIYDTEIEAHEALKEWKRNNLVNFSDE